MKVEIFNIDWCIEEEDIDDADELNAAELEVAINDLKKDLNERFIGLTIEVDDDEDYLDDDLLADMISDETGYLVNNFDYNVIK